MTKWIVIGLAAIIGFQFLRQNSQGGGILGSGLKSGGSGATGFVDSLTGLTNSIGKLIGGSGFSSTSDRDALIKPSF